jgi:hypothetical protein
MSSDIKEESKNNLYFFLENNSNVKEIDIVLNANLNNNTRIKVVNLLMSKDAVELLKESEALAMKTYHKFKDTDKSMKDRYEKHTRLVDELMKVRLLTNP